LSSLWALEWAWQTFFGKSIGIDEINTLQIKSFSSIKIVGATDLSALLALEWAWQTFFRSIDRYRRD